MNRLWVRLTLAFGLVVLVAMGAIGFVINRTTDVEFRQYITRSDIQASGRGVAQLVQYYLEKGNWEGVDQLFSGTVWLSGGTAPPAAPSVGVAHDGTTIVGTRDAPPMQAEVLLADARGQIVYDSTGQAEGKHLKARDKQGASAITLPEDGSVIGYLLISLSGPSGGRLGGLEQVFLSRIQRVLLIGGALTVGLIVVVGAVLSRSLTAPLWRLAAAARAVAKGHLGQKVRVEGSPEIAEVGRAFNEMTSALAEAEAQRKNMVADVAHELRTPLSVLQGNLRAILDGVYPLEQGEIARLYDESLLLGRMVEDLRELALADAGQLRLEARRTDMGQIIRDSLERMAMLAQDREVSMAASLPGNLQVMADPDRVGQILRNLLLNAAQNTPAGGSVTVSARLAGPMLEVSVADTGVGISAENLPHVFERFWRADPSRARPGRLSGGSGIGLAVAQSLVVAQGGCIWAESTLGQGTTFHFTLPLAQAAAV